jgi:hypothetical protein
MLNPQGQAAPQYILKKNQRQWIAAERLVGINGLNS